MFDKRAHALALGQKLAKNEGPEAQLVAQLMAEVSPPEPHVPFSKPPITNPGAVEDDDERG